MKYGAMFRQIACTALLITGAGCAADWWGGSKTLSPPVEPARPQPLSPVLQDTVGSLTGITGLEGQRLRGFGLVVALGDQGSNDCPPSVREFLVDSMAKEFGRHGPGVERRKFSPEQLIDSLDSAEVQITAVVPGGAPKGRRIDVQVEAIPGTSTQSLEGGLLLPTELRFFDPAASGTGMFAGATIGRAEGPIFINPFSDQGSGSTAADPRRGYVLGGGWTIEEHSVRLMLIEPNHNVAKRIESRINQRFGMKPKASEAQSRGYVVLHTPAEYAADPEHFVNLVTHLYLRSDPAFQEMKLRELGQLVLEPDAEYEHIALAWEAIGRGALASIQPLYTNEDEAVAFYAARAGLRLNDVNALPVFGEFAAAKGSPFQLLAVRELSGSTFPQAALKLVPLLDERDQEVRIAAYEGLLKHRHPAIRTTGFPSLLDQQKLNLALDVVDSTGPAMIYVRRSGTPRIALFGARMGVNVPVFYTDKQDSVTVTTAEASGDVTVFARGRTSNRLSDAITIPPRVAELITALASMPTRDETQQIHGLGLPYSQVVQVLSALCESQTILANLTFERTSLTELLGPDLAPARPEVEEAAFEPTEAEAPPAAAASDRPPDAQPEEGERISPRPIGDEPDTAPPAGEPESPRPIGDEPEEPEKPE